MSSDGQHFLIVEPFDPDDDTDRFDVEHPADCPVEHYGVSDGFECAYACHVGYYVEQEGVSEYFRHADDPDAFNDGLPAVAVGRHPIEAWTKKVGWEFTEYDGGLRLTEPEVAA